MYGHYCRYAQDALVDLTNSVDLRGLNDQSRLHRVRFKLLLACYPQDGRVSSASLGSHTYNIAHVSADFQNSGFDPNGYTDMLAHRNDKPTVKEVPLLLVLRTDLYMRRPLVTSKTHL